MTKKQLIFIGLAVLVLTLTLTLSGCGREEADLSGKNIVEFHLNEGTLDYKTASTNTKISFAYYPGTYILDPAKIPGYSITRLGYVFTGWYTSPECTPGDEWDFETQTITSEKLVLYAGWKEAIVHTYSVYYIEGNEEIKLGQYEVTEGATFSDWRNFASTRQDYTPTGYFSDKEMTQKWDDKFTHPGGEEDNNVCVYVSYIEGKWDIVSDLTTLLRAVDSGDNVYLMNDIDCAGEELNFSGVYSGIFEGNGYTVSNFTVKKSGGALIPQCSIFSDLGEKSEIRNVSFTNVTYELFGVPATAKMVKVSALAKSASGTTIKNVSIQGKLVTDYDGDLSKVNSPFYEDASVGDVSGFTAVITVEKQTQ